MKLRIKAKRTSEWQTNVHRDTFASYVGHPALVEHFSIGLGEPQAMVRTRFIDVSYSAKIIFHLSIGVLMILENDPALWPSSPKRRVKV